MTDTRLRELAHDLSNPLSVILLCSEQLSRRLLSEEAPSPHLRRVEVIAKAAEEIRQRLELLGRPPEARDHDPDSAP